MRAIREELNIKRNTEVQQQAQRIAQGQPINRGNEMPNADGTTQPETPVDSYPSFRHVEEIVQIVKTAFPLLILSMETLIDQLSTRFKASPEEELYRYLCALLFDAVQVFHYYSSFPCF
jgi:transformation/transcription domain-associated protein